VLDPAADSAIQQPMVGTPNLQNGSDDISQLLRAWSDGDQLALGELTPIVYAELRRLAHRYMRGERPGHSLQTTGLVNEAYRRLVDYNRISGRTGRTSSRCRPS
jgi:ECF sigma factor